MKAAAYQQRRWKPFHAKLPSKIFAIAAGEGVSRLSNLLLAVFLSRALGVRAVGAYALAVALSLYLMQGTDFGLRHTGARLLGRGAESIEQVVRFIQSRRLLLALLMVALGYWYGIAGPVPQDTRALVSLYSLSILGYGFSVDWMAWGLQRFYIMSGWRALVSVFCVTSTIICVRQFHAGLLIIPLANAVAYIVADSLLWFGWARKHIVANAMEQVNAATIETQNWKSIALLGIALLMNQAFNSVDTMMLGSMTDSSQTGLYSAAYRLLLLVLAIYYLVMQAIYPRIAGIPPERRSFAVLLRPLMMAAAFGMGAAAIMEASRRLLVNLLYGPAFAASASLAGPLMFAIPLDFITSLLVTVLVAWDHPRRVLAATATAVTSNVVLNCFLIPRYKGMGAAFSTPLSYLPFLLVLAWQVHRVTAKSSTVHKTNDVRTSADISLSAQTEERS